MKKQVIALLLAVVMLSACGQTATPTQPATQPAATEPATVGAAQIEAGHTGGESTLTELVKRDLPDTSQDLIGVYNLEVETLNYLWSQTTNIQQFGANCVSGLLQNDEYGNILKDLATDITRSEDGYVWTFTIRPGVMWLDKDGNEICETTAEDFVAAAKWYMKSSNASQTANLVYDVLLNGREVYAGTMPLEEFGLKAIDKYTIEYTLRRPVPYFLSMATYTIFYPACREYVEKFDDATLFTSAETYANNGAYILQSFVHSVEHVYVANPYYYDAENVFCKKVVEIFNSDASTLGPEMFLRGEINSATVPIGMLEQWMRDPEREAKVRPSWGMLFNYFFMLNFWPNPEAMAPELEPENWQIAVNNLAFRKSIFYALNRQLMAEIYEPYDPAAILTTTITPPLFAAVDGKDYTELDALVGIRYENPFNIAEAQRWRDLAIEELTAAGAHFPIIMFHPYQAPSVEDTQKAEVLKQTIEEYLGTDYIIVELEGAPSTDFTANYRRSGNFGILISNWGADYIDPETFTDPMRPDTEASMMHMHKMEDCRDEDGVLIYQKMIDAAAAELLDISKRYNLFAEAEAYLIDQCIAMPFRYSRSYTASSWIPFTGSWSNAGSATLKFKGRIYAEGQFFNTAAFDAAYEQWRNERNFTIAHYEDIFEVVPNK